LKNGNKYKAEKQIILTGGEDHSCKKLEKRWGSRDSKAQGKPRDGLGKTSGMQG